MGTGPVKTEKEPSHFKGQDSDNSFQPLIYQVD